MNLRLFFGITSLLLLIATQIMTAFAQIPQRLLRIQIAYERSERHIDEAIEYIDAANVIGGKACVEYKAGQAITLSPGFIAEVGSTFRAYIEPVSYADENTLRVNAFPNPFEHTTSIEYYLPKGGKVSLWVMDEQGKLVRQLMTEEDQPAGIHHFEWKAESISPGIYMPVVRSNQKQMTTRLVKK